MRSSHVARRSPQSTGCRGSIDCRAHPLLTVVQHSTRPPLPAARMLRPRCLVDGPLHAPALIPPVFRLRGERKRRGFAGQK